MEAATVLLKDAWTQNGYSYRARLPAWGLPGRRDDEEAAAGFAAANMTAGEGLSR